MLDTVIANNETHYDEIQIGQILADSDVDLGDEEACVEVLIARGIRPWQFSGSLTLARVDAHNIRTSRKFLQALAPKITGAAPSLLFPFALSAWALLCLASDAHAAERDPLIPNDYPTLALLSAAALSAVVLLAILFNNAKE
jgi:hypothetical protein